METEGASASAGDAGGMGTGGMDTGGMDTGGMDTGGMDTGGMDTGDTGMQEEAVDLPNELDDPLGGAAGAEADVDMACGPGFHGVEDTVNDACPAGVVVGQEYDGDSATCIVATAQVIDDHCCFTCELTANTSIVNQSLEDDVCDNPTISVAPQGGNYQAVPNGDIWTAINQIAGIALPVNGQGGCTTDPCTLGNAPGATGTHGCPGQLPSRVLDNGGRRVTFVYYIRFECNGVKTTYRAVFSYDLVGNQCATEWFLFGPLEINGNNIITDYGTLLQGLAINAAGGLLPAVPTNIATVDNFEVQDGVDPDDDNDDDEEPVLPGDVSGEGCLRCHAGNGAPEPNFKDPYELQQ